MINQEELTPEQEEALIREDLTTAVNMGNALAKLRKTPEFKMVFDEVFLEKGLEILWQNIRRLEEGQMVGRGSDKNKEVIGMIKGQVKTRLDLIGFLDTVENDRQGAVESLEEMDARDEAEGDTK